MLSQRIRRFILLHKYLLPFWDKQVLLLFSAIGFMSFGILAPYLSRLIIDYAILKGDVLVFKTIILCGIIIFVFSTLIGFIQKYISFFISMKLGFALRMEFYDILCHKPLPFFEKHTTGELLYRLSADTKGVINLITGTLPGLLLTLLKLTAITALCIWLNWKATLLIFSAMPLFYFLNHYFGKKSFHMNKALNERGQVLSKTLQDTLSRIKLYKAFYRERKGLRQYKGETITQMRVLIKNFWLGIMNANSHQVLNTGFGLVLTIYLGLQVLNGKMTLGSYVALSIYLAQLAGILKSLGGAYQGLVSQFVYVDRFFEIYEHGPVGRSFPIKKLPAKASDNKRAVVFDEVTFGYHPENAVLKNITFGLRPGEAAAIIGNSGTGKSTLAHLMLGLYTPSGGRILIHDQDITLTGEDFIRKTVGIVLQDTPLLNTSIKENVTFATTKVSDEEFQQAVRIAEVDSFVNMKKEGYELLIGEQGASLSQGQRQRIAIAMALIKSPAVLILDEATNQLDQGMEARIIRNIRTRLPQTTLVIISCRTNALQLVDTVFELRDGNLMYRGSPCNRTLAAHV